MLPTRPSPHRGRPRRGFTLIELLVAIVIISVLIALLVPAIQRARRTAQVARCKVEITQLASGITAFKAKFGIDPPSRITIYEAASGWTGDPGSAALIRKMWPDFDFADTNRNGDTDMTDSVTLTPAECLVFFLGGVLVNGSPTGFSTNGTNPGLTGGGRDGPFFEFDRSRLVLTARNGFTLATYVDPLSGASGTARPYLYFSTYEGAGYQTADLAGSGIANWYLTAAGGPAWNPQSFQIIGAGFDGDYGSGGVYDTTLPNNGLGATGDFDNVTNFAGGELRP